MKRLQRYIAVHLYQGVALVLLGLLSVDLFLALANELGDLRPGSYTWSDALVYVALTLPRRIYEYLPMAAFAGALVGVGGLAARSELVAMRSAGFSRLHMAGAMVLAATVLALLQAVLGEAVMPRAEQSGRDLKFARYSSGAGQQAGDVIWLRDQTRFMRVLRVQSASGPQFINPLLFRLGDAGRLVQRIAADRLVLEGNVWRLEQVRLEDFQPQQVTGSSRERMEIEPLAEARLLQVGAIKPRFLSLRDVDAIASHLRQRGMDDRSYRVAWWVHVTNPWTLLVLVFAAGTFLHGSQRGGTAGRRLLLGLVLGLGFYVVNRTAANLAQIYVVPIALVVAAPTLLVAGWSLWKYHQQRLS